MLSRNLLIFYKFNNKHIYLTYKNIFRDHHTLISQKHDISYFEDKKSFELIYGKLTENEFNRIMNAINKYFQL